MKKLNNRGMTLVELIVSFLIVTVAMFYFFQTFVTVNDIYKKSVTETKNYVDKDYAIRIIDRYLSNHSEDDLDNINDDINDDIGDIIAPNGESITVEIDDIDEYFKKITVTKKIFDNLSDTYTEEEWFKFYKYID